MSSSGVAIIQGDVATVKAETISISKAVVSGIITHHQSGSSISTSATISTIDCKGTEPDTDITGGSCASNSRVITMADSDPPLSLAATHNAIAAAELAPPLSIAVLSN